MAKIKIQKTDINTVDASQVNEIGNKTWFLEVVDGHATWLKPIASYLLDANNFVNLPAPTKEQVESVLTGEITTHTHTPYPQVDVASAGGTITLATNTVTNLTDTSTGTLTIAFGSTTANKANDYGFVLRIGGTLRTVNWDAGIVWKDGTAPTLAINKTYYFVSSKLGSQYLTAFNTY
jgi:hypothetical protein